MFESQLLQAHCQATMENSIQMVPAGCDCGCAQVAV
jgi:hypothetical protein